MITIEEMNELFGVKSVRHAIVIDESQRQIILLALFKLNRERPGWTYAIGEIEQKLGGQIDWPEPPTKGA
jgi:hypothetical protein